MGSYPGPLSRGLFVPSYLLIRRSLSASRSRPDIITPGPRSPRYTSLDEARIEARIEETERYPIGQSRDREEVWQSGKMWGKVSKNTRTVKKLYK
jgi:hypothetical protein